MNYYLLSSLGVILCAALIWAQVPQNTHFFGQVPPIIQHHQIYPQEIQAIPQVHPPKNKAFDGGAVFATNLLKVVTRQIQNGNFVISPFSAYLGLLIISYGAECDTAAEFVKVLKRPELEITEVIFPSALSFLTELKGAEISIANTAFLTKDAGLKEGYASAVKLFFNQVIYEIDFSDKERSAIGINDWVAEETRHKITNIVSPKSIQNREGIYVLNAIYFKGTWAKPFQKINTRAQPFHYNFFSTKMAPTMFANFRSLEFGKLADLDAKFVVLPYKADGLKMTIIIPNQKNGLWRIENNLQTVNQDYFAKNAREREVDLYLPKFKIESEINLVDALKNLGLQLPFTNEADFGEISDKHLQLNDVITKAYIEINEEGTEAAAATQLEVVPLSLTYPEVVRVDRPSFFMITYQNFNLFSGRLVDPEL